MPPTPKPQSKNSTQGKPVRLLGSLKPNPDNPRTISKPKLDMLRKALAEFGDLSGIVFNRRSGQLVGGHQRVKSLPTDAEITIETEYSKPTEAGTLATGFATISGERFAYREVDWDKKREKAANIAANKGAGEFDPEGLSTWLKELSDFDLGFDLDLTMFDGDELKDIVGITVGEHSRVGATGVDEDEVPEVKVPRAKLGDIYVLGNHRLMCGDSTDIKQVEKLMLGTKAEMLFTDPPYGVDYEGGHLNAVKREKLIGDHSTQIYTDVIPVIAAVVDGPCYTWFASSKPSALYAAVEQVGQVHNMLVWHKTNATYAAMGAQYKHRFEPFLYWKPKRSNLRWCGATTESDLWELKRDASNEYHPTQKPVELAERALRNHTAKNVLDLFGGSGSTLIAAEKVGRPSFTMELSPAYVDVIIERWEKYTGNKATLLNRDLTRKKHGKSEKS